MVTTLKQTFLNLAEKYCDDLTLKEKFWDEINTMYSHKSRHYHTLSHLENLIFKLEKIKNEIEMWDPVLFAVFYHDIIYNSSSNKNEEESADLAELRLTELSVPANKRAKCYAMILATKNHAPANDNDTDYFTDADLSILGQSPEIYANYAKQIRLEYSNYPLEAYNAGRKKVLLHFLKMERIFKTQYFYDQLETQAKENLLEELRSL